MHLECRSAGRSGVPGSRLGARSARTECGFREKMIQLIGKRVFYPDGTAKSFVQRYLRDRVHAKRLSAWVGFLPRLERSVGV